MPGAAIAADKVNSLTDVANPNGRSTAMDAVREAASCREAVNRADLLQGVNPDLVDEIHAVLDALPHAVDQALLAALQSVLDRGVAVTVGWELGRLIGLRLEEDGDGVRIVLITPDGREFTRR
ncbi:MAG TPA: hypothetical protein VGG38_09440 [Acidimicrobiales bacterium]|jgi:hypothetical protein